MYLCCVLLITPTRTEAPRGQSFLTVSCPAVSLASSSELVFDNTCCFFFFLIVSGAWRVGRRGWPSLLGVVAYDEGLRARLASSERYFSVSPVSPAEAQELQASSQQPHPSLQACPLISKHGPLHRLRGSLPATNLSALSGGGWLAACVPSFSRGSSLGPKAIQCLGAPEPVWPHLDPGGRAPAAVLPMQLEPHSEASPKLPWPYVPPLFLDHWAESKHGRKVPQSFRSLGSLSLCWVRLLLL